MTTILITVLFVLQLLSFYFIIILNTKLAKFKDLEKKQERLMREMDDSISLYLTEMKDENNRLIQALQVVPKPETTTGQQSKPITVHKDQKQPLSQAEHEQKDVSRDSEPRILMPKNIVANAYSRQQQGGVTPVQATASKPVAVTVPKEEQKPITLEQQIVQMAKQGKTAEEIAKQLQKGKTEIELLLKFHS